MLHCSIYGMLFQVFQGQCLIGKNGGGGGGAGGTQTFL